MYEPIFDFNNNSVVTISCLGNDTILGGLIGLPPNGESSDSDFNYCIFIETSHSGIPVDKTWTCPEYTSIETGKTISIFVVVQDPQKTIEETKEGVGNVRIANLTVPNK